MAALLAVLLRFEAGASLAVAHLFEFFRTRFVVVDGGGVTSLVLVVVASSVGLFAGDGFSAEAGAEILAAFTATGDGFPSVGRLLLLRGAAEGEKNAAIDACFFYTTAPKRPTMSYL